MFSEVIDGLVEMTADQILERFRDLELRRRHIDAEQAILVAAIDARSIAQCEGHRTINGFLRAELNCSKNEAAEVRALGRPVDQLAGVGEAWMSGRIGRSQVKQLDRARANRRISDRLGPLVPMLVEQAEVCDSPSFAELIDETIRCLDEDGAHDGRDDSIEHRNAHVSAVGDGVVINASGGSPLEAAEMIEIFDGFVEAEFRRDVAARAERHGVNAEFHDLARTARQRRFDALMAMFRAAAASDGSARAARLVLNIVVDAKTFAKVSHAAGLATDTNLAGEPVDPFTGLTRPADLIDELLSDPASLLDRRCETDAGVPVHAHDVLQAALSGHVRRVVVDSKGVVIDKGRKSRLYTGSARDAAKLLVKRCEHPGCLLPTKFCDVDHAEEWDRDDGPTDQANSGIRCNPDNRAKTRHKWRTKRATNGKTYTIREDGTVMLPIGARQPVFDDDPPLEAGRRCLEDLEWDELVAELERQGLTDMIEYS
ncbi:MAG: DUF222 domain-containing protein [Ilumatobacter sp.]